MSTPKEFILLEGREKSQNKHKNHCLFFEVVHSVLKQVKPHLSAKYWIDFTSGHFKTSQDCGEELLQIGTQFLDAGVSGGPDG